MLNCDIICLNLYFKLWVLSNGPGDQGSIPGQVIFKKEKTQKMVFDAILLNTQHYKVCIKGKVEQSREWSRLLLHLSVEAIEKDDFRSLLTMVANNNYIGIFKTI